MARILLAEDSPTHAELICSLLERDHHAVQTVGNGREGIDAIRSSVPDLVVTDLMMPEMNGQQLVAAIAEQFPSLPAIVVTAHGSEGLAVDALANGAANFVPKSAIDRLLNFSVRQVLRLSEVDADFQGAGIVFQRPEFRLTLSNRVSAIERAAVFLMQALAGANVLNPTDRIRVGMATVCALLNSVCFGNLELEDDDTSLYRYLSSDPTAESDLDDRANQSPFSDRRVKLKVSVGDEDTRVQISHDGPGPISKMTPAPGTPESFEHQMSRGLMLITSFMDDVMFRSHSTEVLMIKHHPPLPASRTS